MIYLLTVILAAPVICWLDRDVLPWWLYFAWALIWPVIPVVYGALWVLGPRWRAIA